MYNPIYSETIILRPSLGLEKSGLTTSIGEVLLYSQILEQSEKKE